MTAQTGPAAAILLATAALRRKLVAVTVRGTSMEPTYHDGDRVLVLRGSALSPGQVVVAEQPAALTGGWHRQPVSSRTDARSRRWLIKRLAAVPGDPIPRHDAPALARRQEDRVPPGMVVLLGDNRDMSLDSQAIGYFPVDRVLGIVLRALPRREPLPEPWSPHHPPGPTSAPSAGRRPGG